MIYTIDTNVFVDALRQPSELDHLKNFLNWALPTTVLSSVVVAELSASARTAEGLANLDTGLIAPFERRHRVVAPSANAWRRAGLVLARTGASGVSASRLNDILIAVQAREYGWTIVTRDSNFVALQTQVKGLRVASPFPVQRSNRMI